MKNKYEQDLKPNCSRLVIQSIDPGSIAQEVELEPGDIILSIDSNEVSDELDYMLLTSGNNFTLEVIKQNGELWEVEIEKDDDEVLGINLENTLSAKTCRNHCVFCFIDQMPEGMRESLYVKDDDERLSFINGNYITLTNLTDKEIERICKWKIPVNISVHTTNPKLRRKILGNYKGGNILEQLKKLYDNRVEMNAQIVLVPELNDKDLLETISDLKEFIPYLKTVSIVPVGLTKFRQGLREMRVFTKEEAEAIIDSITELQKRFIEQYQNPFIYLSDEFYLLAGREFPEREFYGDFSQLENGVGMVTDFNEEFLNYLENFRQNFNDKRQLIITGKLFEPILKELINNLHSKFLEKEVKVLGVENNFFGKDITVTGLLTGTDIIDSLKQADLEEIDEILMPEALLKNNTKLLLDDITVKNIEEEIGKPIKVVESDGKSLVFALLGEKNE